MVYLNLTSPMTYANDADNLQDGLNLIERIIATRNKCDDIENILSEILEIIAKTKSASKS